LFIAALHGSSLRVNGAVTNSALLKTDDKIEVGPYEVVVEAPPAGAEFALTVELVVPLGDDLTRLQSHSQVSLANTGLNKRALSWGLFGLVLVLFFILPLLSYFAPGFRQAAQSVAFRPDIVWDTGEVSNPHKNFGAQCESCHQQAFTMVRDAACLACHKDIQHHADPKLVKVASLDDTRCASCHKEHNGAKAALITEQSFCADCHTRIKSYGNTIDLENAGDFLKNHPQFKVTLVADAAAKKVQRVSLDQNPKDQSGLKFPHDKHLDPNGVISPTGRRKVGCTDCHKLEPGGAGIERIRYARHCESCHKLQFEPKRPDRSVPHGQPALAEEFVRDFYAHMALEGGFDELGAPAVVRRRAGTPLPEEARGEALAWARARAQQALGLVFDPRRGCGYCHDVSRKEEGGKVTFQAPLMLLNTFMPKTRFDHQKHASTACTKCHDAEKSKDASDVLMPKIDSCQACHGGEHASNKVQSTCIMCHDFHRHGLPAMRAATR
jgi:predicted CXXCH cytochrome family protein